MNFTRIKTTMMAGVLAAGMLMPGMTALAAVPTVEETGAIITKVVQNPEGTTYTDETFTFTFKQDAKETDSGVEANLKTADIPSVTTDKISSGTTKATDEDGNELDYYVNSTTKSVDLSELDEPGVYTYTVKETARDTSGDKTGVNWTYSTKTYKLRVYVTKNGDGTLTKKMTVIENATGATKATTAEFVNTVTKTGGSEVDGQVALTVGKKVSDTTYEQKNQTYTFTVTFTENSLNTADGKTNTYSYKVVDANGNAVKDDAGNEITGTLTNGSTLTLKNGQYAKFDKVYAGSKVSVVETEVTNLYKVKIEATSNGNTVENTGTDKEITTDDKSGLSISNVLIGEKTNEIVYTNTYKSVEDTGVVTDIAPYATIVVLAVAAVAAYMAMKSRVAR